MSCGVKSSPGQPFSRSFVNDGIDAKGCCAAGIDVQAFTWYSNGMPISEDSSNPVRIFINPLPFIAVDDNVNDRKLSCPTPW
jgi:hypothetical protein